jgi:predicted phosphodiesterase
VVERLRALGVQTIRGNYDQGVGDRSGSCGCYYATDEAKADGAASYEFTARALSEADKDWLIALPTSIRFAEADSRVLLTHGSPRKINEYLGPERDDALLARLAEAAEADVVCVGHVHVPYHRSLFGGEDGRPIHYVSSGSVGKPKDGDPRAMWVELCLGSAEEVTAWCAGDLAVGAAGAGATWAGVIVHRVAYDVETVAAEVVSVGLPPRLAEALRTG